MYIYTSNNNNNDNNNNNNNNNTIIISMTGRTIANVKYKTNTKLRGFSPQANYTGRATAACRQS
jgi:hypothetical protein